MKFFSFITAILPKAVNLVRRVIYFANAALETFHVARASYNQVRSIFAAATAA